MPAYTIRSSFIDFMRGLAIMNMVLVHFNYLIPLDIANIISYLDVAMEGYLCIAGYMVGWYYYPLYKTGKRNITRRLIERALKLTIIQYIMIMTISVPLYYLLYDEIRIKESIGYFLMKSMLFLNQIGIMHILPTFIPLLLISPILLYLVYHGMSVIIIVVSITLFIFGNIDPYIANVGERTIFPVILWQIYYILGFIIGIGYGNSNALMSTITKNNKLLFVSFIIMLIAMIMKHAKIVSPQLTTKFPLNALGLYYGSSLLLFTSTLFGRTWDSIRKSWIVNDVVCLLGRHSLFVFVFHVYIAKGFEAYRHHYDLSILANIILVGLCFVLMYIYIIKSENMQQTKWWGRILEAIR